MEWESETTFRLPIVYVIYYCTKTYYNRTLTVQVIVEDVVTWIFETQYSLCFGKCRLNDYLCSIKAVDSEECSGCGVATETVGHFILDCQNSELCNCPSHL